MPRSVLRFRRSRPRAARSRWRTLLLSLAIVACDPGPGLDEIRARQERGEFAETVEPLRAYVAEHPDAAEASYLYGRALVFTGQASLATWPLREAMEDPDWLIPAGLQLAHATLASNDFNETVEITTRMLEADPGNPTALLFRAQANAHWRSDPEAALADARRLLELEPLALEAYEPLILALLTLDRLDEARAELARAGELLEETEAAPETLAWHCSTSALFAADAGEVDEARERWAQCRERYPSDPTVVQNAVQFYDAQSDWQSGLETLEAAHAAAPNQSLYRTALAGRLAALGRRDEGEALLQAATQVDDPVLAARAWGDFAQFHHAQRDHGAAADDLARAIATIEPVELPSEQLRFQYADALVAAGRLDLASEAARQLSVPAQRRLIEARVAQERGDFEAALAGFDEALRLWPNNPSARYYAARAAEVLGDFDRALEEYRYAIRISPGATDARTRAAELLVAQHQPLLAYQLLFLEVAKAPLEREGEGLAMYLLARVANPSQLQQSLLELAGRDPARLPAALARGAEGAAEIAGPEAALRLLAGVPGMSYTHPAAAPALRAFVRFAHAAGREDLASELVANALTAHPDAAAFHELQGLDRELAGAPTEKIRQAYERARARDPQNARTLAALARLAEDDEPEEALRLFEAAAAADPAEPEHALAAARLLARLGRAAEAAERLDALLIAFPLSAGAAAERARLDWASGRVNEASLERARRALRFEPSEENQALVEMIRSRLEASPAGAG